jgi:O-antigen ligase
VSRLSIGLATIATSGGVLLVLLLFAPALQAPFLVPKFAALEVSASLGFVAFALHRVTSGSPRWTRSVTIGAWLVLATSAVSWIAASRSLGAPYAVDAMARLGSLFGLACAASVLDDTPAARRRVLEACTAAAAVVAAVGLLQHVEASPFVIPVISTPGSTFGNRNAAADAIAMALPLGLGVAVRRRGCTARAALFVALALELAFLAATRARGAWLAGGCGLGAAAWLAKPRWSRASVAAACGAAAVAIATASVPGRYNPRDTGDRKRYSGVIDVLEESVDARSTALRTRFGLWRRTAAMVREYPIFGVGPGNWPVMFPRYAEPGATRDGVLSATLAPRQAHDDLLERAAESGIAGLAALGLLAAAATVAARDRLRTGDDETRALSAGAAGALIALVVGGVSGFPLEMPGTIALAGLALGIVGAEDRPDSAPMRATRRACAYVLVAISLALLSCAIVRADRHVRGSRWLAVAEREMRRDRASTGTANATRALNLALDATPSNYRAQLRSAQMLSREHRFDESIRAARRALALEPYAPNAWAALAEGELDADDPRAAGRDADEALALLHDYPFALQLRAQAAERTGDVSAAEAARGQLRDLANGPPDDATVRAARALLQPGN